MRSKMRHTTFAAGTALLLFAAGCGGGGDEASSPDEGGGSGTTVSVEDNLFDPEAIEISSGDTVTWEWNGDQPHNVSHEDFESEIQTEGTFEQTFDEAGTYEYTCTVHAGMDGVVEVS